MIDRGIPLAILFYNIDTKETKLLEIDNWTELELLDRDINIELIKLQLNGIREEIKDIVKDINFSLDKYTKFFVNELKFSAVNRIEVKNYNKCIERYNINNLVLNCNDQLIRDLR